MKSVARQSLNVKNIAMVMVINETTDSPYAYATQLQEMLDLHLTLGFPEDCNV